MADDGLDGVTVGKILERLDTLIESNKQEHEDIKARLADNEKSVIIFKLSRCALGWLDKKGLLKWAAASAFVYIIDQLTKCADWIK